MLMSLKRKKKLKDDFDKDYISLFYEVFLS